MKKIMFFILMISTIALMACDKKNTHIKEMPSDFAISFSYGINENQLNILDTYKGIIQKDLVEAKVATVDFEIPKSDLKEIYSQIYEYKLKEIKKSMTSKNLSTTNSFINITPLTKYNITFTIDGIEYNVTGDATATNYIEKNKMAKNFCAFIQYMIDYMSSTEEYKSLPKASGGYD